MFVIKVSLAVIGSKVYPFGTTQRDTLLMI